MQAPYQQFFRRIKTGARSSLNVIWLMVAAGYFLVLAGQAAYRSYQTKQDTENMHTELTGLKIEKARWEALLIYYQTETYKEKELRRALLLKRPEEKVYVLPESFNPKNLEEVALVAPLAEVNSVSATQNDPTWKQWINYLFPK